MERKAGGPAFCTQTLPIVTQHFSCTIECSCLLIKGIETRLWINMGRQSSIVDRQVFDVVLRELENDDKISVFTVYERIQSSNSPLKRTKKNILLNSIERAITELQHDSNDSDAQLSEHEKLAPDAEDANANAMNERMRASMRKQLQRNGTTPVHSEGEQTRNLSQDAPEVKSSGKKRNVDSTDQRPAKRSRTKENGVLPAPTYVSLADIGGMDHIISRFTELLMLPLLRPERYLKRGLKIPRGILLHGPPGCGKTMLCEALAGELGLPWLPIQGPSIVSGMSGESERALRQHFEAAIEAAPCIMFIDEIDAITPKRETAQREMERRIVGQLLTCMDDLALEKTGGKPVIVLAATNRPDSLDPALRRAGRFDEEINVGVPSERTRESILRAQTRRTEISPDVDFAKLAKLTPGFVGADLESLISKAGSQSNARYLAAIKALSDALPLSGRYPASVNHEKEPMGSGSATDMDVDSTVTTTQSVPPLSETIQSFRHTKFILDQRLEPEASSDVLTMSDFVSALPHVQPSAKREGFATIPDTTWASIGALLDVRKQLHNAIVEPIRNPDKYRRFGISVPAGVLLWGPPGCGKTLLAKAVANESKANFISVKGPELLNKFVGESERAVRQVFLRAASSVPCVIFFDELDALVPRRDDSLSEASARVVNTLLTELDGLTARGDIYVIAATNRPEMIDPAMLRPGRLGKHLQVWLPGAEERVEILKTLLRKMPVRNEDDRAEFAKVAQELSNFSGADLSSLAYEAAQRAVEQGSDVLERIHLEEAVPGIKPSVNEQDLARYERFKEGFFQRGVPRR